jgi:hypothetical protein
MRLVLLLLALSACEKSVPLCEEWSGYDLPRPHKLVDCWKSRMIAVYGGDDEELRTNLGMVLFRAGFRSGKRLGLGADIVMRRTRDHQMIELSVKDGVADLKRGSYEDWEVEED